MKSLSTLREGGQVLQLIFNVSDVSLETVDQRTDIWDIAWADASNRLWVLHGVSTTMTRIDVGYISIAPTGTCTWHLN